MGGLGSIWGYRMWPHPTFSLSFQWCRLRARVLESFVRAFSFLPLCSSLCCDFLSLEYPFSTCQNPSHSTNPRAQAHPLPERDFLNMFFTLPWPQVDVISHLVSYGMNVTFSLETQLCACPFSSAGWWMVFLISAFSSFLNDMLSGQECDESLTHERRYRNFGIHFCCMIEFIFLGWKIWQTRRISKQTSNVTGRCHFMVI